MKFLVYPAPAQGHIHPMIPLLRELVARKDEVIVYTTRDFEELVGQTGAAVRLIPECLYLSKNMREKAEAGLFHQLLGVVLDLQGRGMREVPSLLEQARSEGADAILYEPMAAWGRIVARLLRLPTALFQTGFSMLSPTIRKAYQEDLQRLPSPRLVLPLLVREWRSRMLQWRHGVPHLSLLESLSVVEALNIHLIPRQYQPDAGFFDERFLFMGPSAPPGEEVGDFPLESLAGAHVLLIDLGPTAMNQQRAFYKACFEAFRGTHWRVVMVCDARVDLASLGPVPANFLVRPRVPRLAVLAQTRIFLTHGGMRSTMEGLWQGVPLAILSQTREQFVNAARVSELGLGWPLSPEDALQPRRLREAIERLDMAPGLRERLAGFQAELRHAGGPRRAADALHALVASRRLFLRQVA